jgi:hypothetical protein
MNAEHLHQEGHLQAEELETFAIPGDRQLPARSSAHVAGCDRCRRDVEELQALHALLQALAPLQPMVGFSDRVMQRVRLPLPWRLRVLEAVRRHQIAAAAAVAGAVAAVGVGLMWISRYPELTPVTIAAFLVERSTALLWSGVMAVGRLAYGSGALETAQGLAGQLSPATAFVAVATVLLVGLGALRIMLSLMDIDPAIASGLWRQGRRARG